MVFGELAQVFLLSKIYFHGSTEALEFAQSKLTPFGKVQKYVEKLEVGSSSIRIT